MVPSYQLGKLLIMLRDQCKSHMLVSIVNTSRCILTWFPCQSAELCSKAEVALQLSVSGCDILSMALDYMSTIMVQALRTCPLCEPSPSHPLL